ncbi:MAG: EFR1 family ferrodoxin [Lachnospiraceae bacterium]|nr:EFR1 family ferrodoxin [Lachnospiraceae bacterium]
MNIAQIVFSPTGGTQKVADSIMDGWTPSITKIDLTNAATDYSGFHFQKEDVVLIAIPSYGGRVPVLAAQRIAKIHGNQAQCIIVCVYGNRAYEDTLIELKDIAEQCDFQITAAVSAIAEHSIMHQYATGRPDQKDQEELSRFGKKISDKINNPDLSTVLSSIPGNHPYKKAGGAGLVPKANGTCTKCGLCADNCPAQAISKENLKSADNKKCISCMRCVVQCPESARKVNGAMVSIAALAIKKACSERKENELFI